ncbi:pectin acetylesterase-family hydrolase [Paenibacillus sp. MMS20-IR301]|uniref:pectin acetylesterase-family hydrolase n=1 Tax=Paenibacillus sp. MMS20-IR301 TaxID=2895946 RepID=UPI0028E7776E|nr:pectin acetylesterase-family hydrolase [Paenibacillus sp. MMS20-IR301]WNS46393.1 pectin acetylesterase-family hydrolase [Paenibacillus sp. MMS20-IR301]
MRKIRKFTIYTGIGLLSLILIAVAAVSAFVIKRPATTTPVITEVKPYEWNKVKLSGNAISSDGSEYFLWNKTGESDNWIIFFSGGGASWDAQSAAHPIKLMNFFKGGDTGNYFPDIPFYMLTLLRGMMDTDNPDNPFHGWNVVYLPYSTGDFHIGNRTAQYTKDDGSPFTMRYNGSNNVRSALEWIYSNVDKPDKLLIAGESAGGFGSAFWAPQIAAHYEDSEIFQYSDSSFLRSDKWPAVINEEWQADFVKNFGYAPEADIIGAAFKANGRLLPAGTIQLQSYSVFDEILIHFQNNINDYKGPRDRSVINEWSQELRQSVSSLAAALPNYYYYLTDYGLNADSGTTPHTFATRGTFFEAEQDGVKLLQWLGAAVNQQKPYSVGSEFLMDPGPAQQ